MMRIIVISGKKGQKKIRLILELLNKKAIKDVKALINGLRCQEAISNILSKGKFIKELAEEEIATTPSDLILTDTNAYWSLI